MLTAQLRSKNLQRVAGVTMEDKGMNWGKLVAAIPKVANAEHGNCGKVYNHSSIVETT